LQELCAIGRNALSDVAIHKAFAGKGQFNCLRAGWFVYLTPQRA
jgi:hypothetical protein